MALPSENRLSGPRGALQGAGVEIYPGSTCTLSDSGIHHCKEGILIKVGAPPRGSGRLPRVAELPGGVLGLSSLGKCERCVAVSTVSAQWSRGLVGTCWVWTCGSDGALCPSELGPQARGNKHGF